MPEALSPKSLDPDDRDSARERALAPLTAAYRFALPRMAMTGRLGDRMSASAGSSIEIHDFREYQPGDDVRQLDWAATARTGRPVVRVRQHEIAPRAEIVVDASRSMALDSAKAERTQDLAAWFARLARSQGLATRIHWVGERPQRVIAGQRLEFDGTRSLRDLVPRLGLRATGVRVVVSDLLFEGPFRPLFTRLATGAALLALVQVLSPEDREPSPGPGTRLVDSETQASLDLLLAPDAVRRYRARFAAHQAEIDSEARRIRGRWVALPSGGTVAMAAKLLLAARVIEPRGRG